MIPNPSEPQESGSLPDSNTSEAILYGPAYSWIKSALWAWDEMEDYLMRKADSLEGQIMDRKWASDVLRTNRFLIFSRSPPVNELSKLQDLVTLRELCKTVAGIRKVDEYKIRTKSRKVANYVWFLAEKAGMTFDQLVEMDKANKFEK